MTRASTAFLLALAGAAPLWTASAEAATDRLCPMIYRPVCAISRYHHKETFSNRCVAEAANAHVIYEGRCRYRRR